MLKSIWHYRHFIISSIKNEYLTQFARSKVGVIWMVLHPLAQVAIYAFILSSVLATKLPSMDHIEYAYAIYLMAGFLAWSLFSEVFSRCLTVFINNGNLLKKMAFPRIALPLILIGNVLINNLLMVFSVVIVFTFLGHMPTLTFLWLPFLMLITLLLAVGLGLILGIMNVFVRDIGQFAPVALQFWFWFTPIVYISSILPESYRGLLYYNPLTGIVVSYQQVLVFNQSPDIAVLYYPISLAMFFLVIAWFIYKKANEEMVDVL